MTPSHMTEQDALWVGVDVGGTKVLAGVVDETGTVLHRALRRTPHRGVRAADLEEAVVAAVLDVAGGQPIAGVGLAAAGFVDAGRESVVFAPHLPWRDEPVRSRLAGRWGVPVVLDNDANAAAWAEWRYGAAQGTRDALVVTLGTGIGGGLILDGHVHRGRSGMAGEFGHMQVVPDGLPCECRGTGCWEQYCSGNALVRFARTHLGRSSVLEELCGGEPAHLTGPLVTVAAGQGDAVALEAFESVGGWLGVGLANLVAAFDPELLVIGGGVSAAGERLLEPARIALHRSLVGVGHRDVPEIVLAVLGPEAGLVGAADLVRLSCGGTPAPAHRPAVPRTAPRR